MKLLMKLSLLFVLICNSISFASFSRDDVGTSGAQFLKIGVGARGIGMGSAMSAVTDDVNSVYWNPAGLNRIKTRQSSIMHYIWFEDISYQTISYAHPVMHGVYGISINYLSMTPIDGLDNQGNATNETFAPSDMAVNLAYARRIKDFLLGSNVKYISSNIEDESATAYALDLGAQYLFKKYPLLLGFALQNMGTKIKFINEEDPLPFNIKIGSGYTFMIKKSPLLIALDFNLPVDDQVYINFGTEYKYSFSKIYSLMPRLGFKQGIGYRFKSIFNKQFTMNPRTGGGTPSGELEGLSDISLGLGFGVKDMELDYAWTPYGEIGITHQLSLSIKFKALDTKKIVLKDKDKIKINLKRLEDKKKRIKKKIDKDREQREAKLLQRIVEVEEKGELEKIGKLRLKEQKLKERVDAHFDKFKVKERAAMLKKLDKFHNSRKSATLKRMKGEERKGIAAFQKKSRVKNKQETRDKRQKRKEYLKNKKQKEKK